MKGGVSQPISASAESTLLNSNLLISEPISANSTLLNSNILLNGKNLFFINLLNNLVIFSVCFQIINNILTIKDLNSKAQLNK